MSSRNAAGAAFDYLAATYDQDFVKSAIGETQRRVVMRSARKTFRKRKRILELNCGTGKDAAVFARNGWKVLALDASEEMIRVASSHAKGRQQSGRLKFACVASEELDHLAEEFDAVFSNFSGLNCVRSLKDIASSLAARTSSGSPLVFCVSTRFCLWETAWYLATGQPRKAFRRWRGRHIANVGTTTIEVFYPRLPELRASFLPHFRLEKVRAVGLTVPPSYLEKFFARHPRLLRACAFVDRRVSHLPVLRTLGDHMLLTFRKTV